MSTKKTIEARILKGFRDFLPQQEAARHQILSILQKTVKQYGFVPIDTPAIEYTEVLLGKGGGETDKQVYRFIDNGSRDVSLRFDLTVPFARYMAMHKNELYLPFKRFHFGKVWRGENTQKGRYREFMQCDFDIVGLDSESADFEILLLMNRCFAALGINAVHFHLSHRGIFNKFLSHLGISEHSAEILRTVDKLRKIGSDETLKLLTDLLGLEAAQKILAYISGPAAQKEQTVAQHNLAVLQDLQELSGGESAESQRMTSILKMADELGIADKLVFDASITRGLDYYTGIVYETFLDELPGIGSVCSGGRYNDLASLYSNEPLPGVGASIGLDRLIAALEELNIMQNKAYAADVIVLCQDENLLSHYHLVAETLRSKGLSTEVYPSAKKLNLQFGYAEKKGIPWGIIIGESEKRNGTLNLKNLAGRTQHDGIGLDQAIVLLTAET